MSTLEIDITAITERTDGTYFGTYSKSSGPDEATVDSSGNIDVSAVEGGVNLKWTLGSAISQQFTGNPWGVMKKGGGETDQYTNPTVSTPDRASLTVTDANTEEPADGYEYTLSLTGNVTLDPSIINR